MIVVTGAAGFIGSAFITYLNKVEPETKIIAVDSEDLNSETSRNLNNLKLVDYIDKESFINNPRIVDTIIHFGAKSSTTNTNFSDILKYNYQYSKRLLNFCIGKKIKFVYASSASTYGNGDRFSDNMTPDECSPISPYSFFKNLFDKEVLESKYKKALGLKYFNVFGPNEYHKNNMRSFIFKTYQHALNNVIYIPIFDVEDKKLERDFIYIKDAVKMTYHLYKNNSYGMYNIGTGQSNSWDTVAGHILKICNKEIKYGYGSIPEEMKSTYQYYTKADMNKFIDTIKLPFITCPLQEAISDYILNYLSKGELNLQPSDDF